MTLVLTATILTVFSLGKPALQATAPILPYTDLSDKAIYQHFYLIAKIKEYKTLTPIACVHKEQLA